MIKLTIGIIVLAVAGVAWLRTQWAVDKNKRAADKLIDGLKNGSMTIESFEESLDMLIKTRQLPDDKNLSVFLRNLPGLTNKKLDPKFTVKYALSSGNKGIVIAEGVVKDTISVASNHETDITYPCWVYIHANPSQQEIYFKSTMPDGKDHHHLLEDISDEIYKDCLK
jgi:hypothetical protein